VEKSEKKIVIVEDEEKMVQTKQTIAKESNYSDDTTLYFYYILCSRSSEFSNFAFDPPILMDRANSWHTNLRFFCFVSPNQ
jgi:hypothetical protein